MATAIFQDISLGGTLGVILLGACVSSMMYGVTCLQTFAYYRSAKAKSDSYWLHTLVNIAYLAWGTTIHESIETFSNRQVAVLLVLDTTHQAVVIHIVYNYLVLDFANPLAVVTSVWSVPTEVLFNGVLALILNAFLTFRLWCVSRLYTLTAFGVVLTIASFGTNITYGSQAYQYTNLFEEERSLRPYGIAALCTAVATEVTLSFSLAYYLHTRRSGVRRSDDIVTKLIALTITTGMLTTLTNFVDLIAYLTAHNNLYVLFFNFLLGKLYANAILTSLNSRGYVLGNGQGPSDHEAIRMPSMHIARSGSTGGTHEYPAGRREIHIDVNRLVTSDAARDDSSARTKFESV